MAEPEQQKSIKTLGGTHGPDAWCTCTPGPNEICVGYRRSVSQTCPGCHKKITGETRNTTDNSRMNGDAYGWIYLTCDGCGLVQKQGWDDA
jgi:hypothetical protein